MAKQSFPFRFVSRLSPMKGNFISTVIYLPDEIVSRLPEGRVRAEGVLNGAPFALAPQHKKDGSRFFIVSSGLRKAAGIKEGDKVEVMFKLVDSDKVNIPEELKVVLQQDEQAMKVWKTFSSGMQRNFIIYVNSARSIDTKIKRALESMEKAKRQPAYFQAKKGKK
jgi:bifunctional DNA-binding transcriptional regulator/antitoxin component of YhaV-PrlF toxin-antitoxin module